MTGPDDQSLAELAQRLGRSLRQQSATVTTAESCTGGWIAKALTDIAGSSDWFHQGYVTYSDRSKQSLLGVEASLLAEHGAVSEAVVRQMAGAALVRANADYAVAVSGIAGPGGGSVAKPIGTVWFAFARAGFPSSVGKQHFSGDRDRIRRQAVAYALRQLTALVAKSAGS